MNDSINPLLGSFSTTARETGGHKRWLVYFLLFFSCLICYTLRVALSTIIIPMSADYGWSETTKGDHFITVTACASNACLRTAHLAVFRAEFSRTRAELVLLQLPPRQFIRRHHFIAFPSESQVSLVVCGLLVRRDELCDYFRRQL
jgi:hypothetical protein